MSVVVGKHPHPLRALARDARALARDARASRYLGWRLFRRDLSAEFDRARLGWLWNFADPLVLAAVFVLLRRGEAVAGTGVGVPYSVWVVLGMLSLQAFLNALTRPLKMLDQSRALRMQVPVKPAALLTAQLLRRGFDAAFFVPVMLAVLLWCGLWTAAGLLLGAALYGLIVAAGFALGVALVPLNAVFDDVAKAVGSLNRPLLFLCPTFWYFAPGEGVLGTLSAWNPLATLMNQLRFAATGLHAPAAVALEALPAAAGVAALLAAAALAFHRTLPVINAGASAA